MQHYVISLEQNNSERRAHISTEFKAQDINFEFYNAITPDQNDQVAHACGLTINTTQMTAIEIACFLSHVSLWKKMLDDNLDIIGVFEDDIHLSPQAGVFLQDPTWIPNQTDIIKLEKFSTQILRKGPRIAVGQQRTLSRLAGRHLGTAGYLITRRGAKSLLKKLQQSPSHDTIDQEMFGHLLKHPDYTVLQINPALCIQDFILHANQINFPSAIEADRRALFLQHKTHKQQQLTRLGKVKREITRLVLQFKKSLITLFRAEKILFK